MGDTTANRDYRKPQSTDSAASLTDYWRNLADDIDADVQDNIITPRDAAWTDHSGDLVWTGSTSNGDLGDSTVTSRYAQIGKTVVWKGSVFIGSGATLPVGTWGFDWPVTPVAAGVTGAWSVGTAYLWDASVAGNRCVAAVLSSGVIGIFFVPASGNGNNVTNSNPFAWTSPDRIAWAVTYEAA